MSKAVLYMSMSLDGFIAGPNDGPGNPGGDGFVRLHDWYGFGPNASDEDSVPEPRSELGRRSLDEINATGAVLAGRRTVEQVDQMEGQPSRRADLRPKPPPTRRARRELPVGHIRNGWHR